MSVIKSRMIYVLAIIILCSCFQVSEDKSLSELENKLKQLSIQYNVPGISAGIVVEGKLIWTKGFGYADIENKIVPDENTPYRLASVSKPVASVLIMQLLEKGQLSLDVPMDNYPNIYHLLRDRNITFRHVYSHTSHDLGKTYKYNGAAFGQLTLIVEEESGKSYHQLLKDEIIEKLNLKNTSVGQFVDDYEDVNSRLAKPYELTEEGDFKLSNYIRGNANTAAGLISSVSDLAIFDAALDGRKLIKAKSIEMMFTPTLSTDGTMLPYGLGWFVQEYMGKKVVWHYGHWNCSSTLYMKIPEDRITFILLANSDALSSHFPLHEGDVTVSDFANAFLVFQIKKLHQPKM